MWWCMLCCIRHEGQQARSPRQTPLSPFCGCISGGGTTARASPLAGARMDGRPGAPGKLLPWWRLARRQPIKLAPHSCWWGHGLATFKTVKDAHLGSASQECSCNSRGHCRSSQFMIIFLPNHNNIALSQKHLISMYWFTIVDNPTCFSTDTA